MTSSLCLQQQQGCTGSSTISDPGLRCKLFDSLVLPILSYASEVWAVDDKIGDAAELLHRQFLKHLLGVRDSTANVIVLAELGRFPLCFHWWQQILRYHNRINDLSDDERLIKCAFVEGMHDPAHLFWSHKIHNWLQGQSEGLGIEDELDVVLLLAAPKSNMHKHGIRIVSAVLLGTNPCNQNMS